ncbi:connectin [Ixodes scapularis]|uniref:connectin n=1 Tax=Ixodes scapularis TaxID=6945 RepID=UPI001A9E26F6|nr:connectin [Ixodes scapularis]
MRTTACSARLFREHGFGPRYLTLFLIFLTATFQAGASEAEDLVPNLCNLIDQALYCRCDTDDITDDATEVTCYVVKDIAEDDIVFKALVKQPSIVSIVFSSLSEDHHLKFVPSGVLPHAAVLERLKFSQAELGVLKTHAFYNLTKLAVLSLDSNEITELETDCISHLPRLKKLELADNKLKKMPARALSHLPSLTHLFLERNKMTVIEDFAFTGFGKVKELDLSDNSIEALTEHSFKGLSRVLRLDMFRNKLKRLEARVFGGLSSLVELDLKYNEISEVDPLAFEGLPHLTIVYLSFNRLRVLPAHMFMGAPNLVTVDLSQNQLVTLTWRTVQDLRKIDAESFDMSLTGNKFSCDCRLVWMLHLENATRNDKLRRELRHVKCDFQASGNLSSSKVSRLSASQLGCPANYARPEFRSAAAIAHSTTRKASARPPPTAAGKGDKEAAEESGNRINDGASPDPDIDPDENKAGNDDDVQLTKNDIEVVLNQRKGADVLASSSRGQQQHRGNGAASGRRTDAGWCLVGLFWSCMAAAAMSTCS